MDEVSFDYDVREREKLANALESAVKSFLNPPKRGNTGMAKHFLGWTVTLSEVDSEDIRIHLGSPDGVAREITADHFDEVRRYLPFFTLRLPVHNNIDSKTRSPRLTQQCYLEYNVKRGESAFGRTRIVKIALWFVLIGLAILFMGVFGLFVKHTEQDSARLGPIWRILSPDY